MIDNYFRKILPSYLGLLIKFFLILKITPNQISFLAFLVAVLSAALVYSDFLLLAALVWWISRLLDACDGIFARSTNQASNFGAFLDVQLDMAAYSLMIIAFYFRFPEFSFQWILMLFCYVLCISGALGLGAFGTKLKMPDQSERNLRLAAGLAEAGETGIAYTVFLLLPQYLSLTTWVWVTILLITIVARMGLAWSELKVKSE
jgi:phosphatidylglycerophosphate synthase